MNKTLIFILLFCCVLFKIHSQAVGQWDTYYSYSSVDQLIETPEKIYAVASGSLFSCDKDGNPDKKYTKSNGLSDQSIAQIAYNQAHKAILLAYSNGNIDVIVDNTVFNIPDFMNKIMSGDKTIYYIHFDGDFAYIATGVGVLVVNVKKYEIFETYEIRKGSVSLPIYGITTTNDFVYASTKEGVFKGEKKDNLIDFNNWNLIAQAPQVQAPDREIAQQVVSFAGGLFLRVASNGLWKLNGSNFTRIIADGQISNLVISNGRMLATSNNKIYSYESESTKEDIALSGITTASTSVYSGGSKNYWVAAKGRGLLKVENGTIIKPDIKPDGPEVNSIYKQVIMHGRLYCTDGNQRPSLYPSKIMIYDLQSHLWKIIPTSINNINNIAVHPTNPNLFYVTSSSTGLHKFENDEFVAQYTANNSETGLEFADDASSWTWVSSPAFDKDFKLWMGNAQCFYGIKILNTNGTWEKKAFDLTKEFRELFISSDNKKWFLGTTDGRGRFVFILDDTKNVRYGKFKDQDGNTLDAETYHSIVEDKQKAIWIGTNRGIITIPNPSKIFDADFNCTRVKIPRNDGSGLADYLLDSELINAIVVDGGNRKWIGTENSGLYLVSSDGLQTIEHFTIENSLLPSNAIRSLSITSDGLLFIGTNKGLLSYKTTASEGKIDYSNVYVYPNPVRPEYDGWVTITGLIENSTVKITDISGNMVYEGISQGGQLSWNGRDSSGNRPATGVYLVYSSANDGNENVVTKIMMVK